MDPGNRQLEHHEVARARLRLPLRVLIDDFDVPMNVGSVFRLCDALGVERLYLTGRTPVPPNRKIGKTSRSTEKHVPYTYAPEPEPVLAALVAEGFTVVALEITSGSVDLRTVDFAGMDRIVLVVGAENAGIRASLLALARYTVHIPMLGNNSSMNVATACAIALFEIARSRIP